MRPSVVGKCMSIICTAAILSSTALMPPSAVEPVTGHLKAEHRMGRNYLWFRRDDAANAILAAVGYNFRRTIA
jgi:hypothetical protein